MTVKGRGEDEEIGLPWGIHTLASIYSANVQAGLPDGRWVFAVADPCTWSRWRAAWWVLTGRAYALRWPVAGELEDVLGISRLRRPTGLGPSPGQQAESQGGAPPYDPFLPTGALRWRVLGLNDEQRGGGVVAGSRVLEHEFRHNDARQWRPV